MNERQVGVNYQMLKRPPPMPPLQAVSVGPRDSAPCMWLLVAHTAGHLLLPTARLAAPRINCSLATQAQHINVAPF